MDDQQWKVRMRDCGFLISMFAPHVVMLVLIAAALMWLL